MSTLVQRQHYVWRKYLGAWAESEKIWTLVKDQNKIIRTDLMNVAQERYFYKLTDITEFEEKFLKETISRSHPTLKGLQNDFLLAFTIHTALRKVFEKNPSDKIQQQLKEIEINSMEKAHGLMENSGHKLVECRSFEDITFLKDPDSKNDAIMFLCFQYFRTKKMKGSVLGKMIGNSQFNPENVWNIMSFLMATNVSMNVALNPKLRFLFLNNETDQNFLTTDQPVINTLGDKVDENGDIIELEFYYPLSPKLALIIDFKNENNSQFQYILTNSDMVTWFNRKLLEHSDNFVFSIKKEQLEQITNEEGLADD